MNFDQFESTFTFTGPTELTVAIGLSEHPATATVTPDMAEDKPSRWINLWEEYRSAVDGKLGTAVILAPEAAMVGKTTVTPANSGGSRPDLVILAKVKSGEPLRYYVGAGWDKAGEFTTRAAWDSYVAAFATRIVWPVKVTAAPAP